MAAVIHRLSFELIDVEVFQSSSSSDLEILIDDQPLAEWISLCSGDPWQRSSLVTPFYSGLPRSVGDATRRRLRGHPPAECELLLCPCGDPQCGAVTVEVRQLGGHVHWRRLRVPGREVEHLSFCFEREAYLSALAGTKLR